MPSPGQSSIKTTLLNASWVYSGVTLGLASSGGANTADKLATGMHNGWTCASPSTISTMHTTIPVAFSGVFAGSGGYGQTLTEMGQGIDNRTQAWASSWNGSIHTDTVTTANTESAILAAITTGQGTYASVQSLAHQMAVAFMSGFGQETG